MLTLQYKNGFFKISETIGKGEFNKNIKTDVQVNLELLTSPPEVPLIRRKNSFELNTPNFIVDVSQDEETLYGKIHKSTREDIRKAIKNDQLIYNEIEHPSDSQLSEFALLYKEFAKAKNIPPCNMKKLLDIRSQNSLVMISITNKNNEILCSGVLCIDRNCKQLYGLYSATIRLSKSAPKERRLVGRANRYLYWKTIQLAKRKGLNWCNFGGEVKENKGQGVNEFKRKFGTIQGYDRRIYTSKSMLGTICVNLLYFKWKLKLKS